MASDGFRKTTVFNKELYVNHRFPSSGCAVIDGCGGAEGSCAGQVSGLHRAGSGSHSCSNRSVGNAVAEPG